MILCIIYVGYDMKEHIVVMYKKELNIPLEKAEIKGELDIPDGAKSVIIFAHGSGSSRHSPRNQMVSEYLLKHNLGTLLFDLLTKEEDQDYSNRFNIELLANRLVAATEWLQSQYETKGLYYSYFGASTGAAAALIAASMKPQITAVVSRGGRPDLAMASLPNVKAPTLLIVGSLDTEVLQLNVKAIEKLEGEKRLEIVEGASHLFEEPGTMDKVCNLAVKWFKNHFTPVI
jgi:putative phosphoribosyl transferase